jgi:HEAT repeat protein
MNDLEQQKKIAREKRGEVSTEFLKQYEAYTDQDLIQLLNNYNPQVRASAAQILGQRRCLTAISNLCIQFIHEKALYAKIAISNALSSMGTAAIPELLQYIGKIGDNQHQDLLTDIFKKWNYPCPRDIAIRCIIRIGQPALEVLNEYSGICNQAVLSEIIDAIGHISFYEHDQSSFGNLMVILKKYQDDKVIIWKVIRALQAFSIPEAVEALRKYLLQSDLPEHRWEAARSLGQIATLAAEEYLKIALRDDNVKVREMVQLSLKHFRDKSSKQ